MLMHLLNAMSVSRIMRMTNKEGHRPSEASDVSMSPRSDDQGVVVYTSHTLEPRESQTGSIAVAKTDEVIHQEAETEVMKQALNEFMDPRQRDPSADSLME